MGEMLEAIERAKRPLALTGAGISAPSGIPTFDMPWKGRNVRDFLGRSYFRRDPVGFYELFCTMQAWCDAEPNAAHRALAEKGVRVVTQNIDGLHQKAGSKDVIELHGNLRMVKCPKCGKQMPAADFCSVLRPLYAKGDTQGVLEAIRCECGGLWDMDVVLYEDAVRDFEKAVDWLMESDLLVVIGTALEVYPAAALPEVARDRRVPVMIENEDCIAALTLGDIGIG